MGRVTVTEDACPAPPCPPPRPGAEQQALPACTPEQEVHCGYLLPGAGLQFASAVPLVEEVLGSGRVEGGQWVPALCATSLTSPRPPGPGPARPPAHGSHMSPGALRTPSGQISGLFRGPPSNR